MSATRNKKTRRGIIAAENIHMNTINKYTGKAANNHTFLPGNGLLSGKWVIRSCPNGCDIESQLFGIGPRI
jgi:hypothetical protein